MQATDSKSISRAIVYLSGQNDFVTVDDIAEEVLSGFKSNEPAESALSGLGDILETKENAEGKTSFRLTRSFYAYKTVFNIILKSGEDAYGFLSSGYSNEMIDEGFIEEALWRIAGLPYFNEVLSKYPDNKNPGAAILIMLSRSPGFKDIAAMLKASPSVAIKLLFPERLSRYEVTHLKAVLDLAFASDMLERVPSGAKVSVKYEIIARGTIDLEARGGTEAP